MMLSRACSFLFLELGIITIAGCDSGPTETTVCEILKNPPHFDGARVRFRAAVITDWQHGMALFHPSCGGIELRTARAASEGENSTLMAAVGTLENGGTERTAVGTFTGVLRVWPSAEAELADQTVEFDAERIENIKVYPKRRG